MNFKLNLRDREILKQVQDDGEGGDPESHSAIKKAVECHSGPDPESLWREILNPVQDDSCLFRMTERGEILKLVQDDSCWFRITGIGLEFAVL